MLEVGLVLLARVKMALYLLRSLARKFRHGLHKRPGFVEREDFVLFVVFVGVSVQSAGTENHSLPDLSAAQSHVSAQIADVRHSVDPHETRPVRLRVERAFCALVSADDFELVGAGDLKVVNLDLVPFHLFPENHLAVGHTTHRHTALGVTFRAFPLELHLLRIVARLLLELLTPFGIGHLRPALFGVHQNELHLVVRKQAHLCIFRRRDHYQFRRQRQHKCKCRRRSGNAFQEQCSFHHFLFTPFQRHHRNTARATHRQRRHFAFSKLQASSLSFS